MSKLNEILGVEDGQEFGYKTRLVGYIKCKIINGTVYIFDGHCWVGYTDAYILTEMINYPEKIEILSRKPKLTKQQIAAIKGRIAEGWLYIAKDLDGEVIFYEIQPEYYKKLEYFDSTGDYSIATLPIYDFLKPCECFYLPDLIKEEKDE